MLQTKLFSPLAPQPKLDGSSVDLMDNQLIRQKHLSRQHALERQKLSKFIEREFKRQLNDIPARSRTAITCSKKCGIVYIICFSSANSS
jgi:hypothetical protein